MDNSSESNGFTFEAMRDNELDGPEVIESSLDIFEMRVDSE